MAPGGAAASRHGKVAFPIAASIDVRSLGRSASGLDAGPEGGHVNRWPIVMLVMAMGPACAGGSANRPVGSDSTPSSSSAPGPFETSGSASATSGPPQDAEFYESASSEFNSARSRRSRADIRVRSREPTRTFGTTGTLHRPDPAFGGSHQIDQDDLSATAACEPRPLPTCPLSGHSALGGWGTARIVRRWAGTTRRETGEGVLGRYCFAQVSRAPRVMPKRRWPLPRAAASMICVAEHPRVSSSV